jgi:hypothetical protein
VNLVILLNLAAQMAFLFGLWGKTQGRAVTTVLSVFVAWCIVPLIIRIFADAGSWILYFSPIGGLLVNQFPRLGLSQPPPGMFFSRLSRPAEDDFHAVIHYAIYGAIVGTLVWVNHGVARRVLLRPRTFSAAPTHQRGLFLQD